MKIENLTNSPYQVIMADGSQKMLPARGTLNGVKIHPMHLPLYRALGYFRITEQGDATKPSGTKKKKGKRAE